LYQIGDLPKRRLHGKIDRVGSPGTTLTFDGPVRTQRDTPGIGDLDHRATADFLIDWLEQQIGLASLTAVGPPGTGAWEPIRMPTVDGCSAT